MGSRKADAAPSQRANATGRWVATSHVSADVVRSNLVPGLVQAGSLVTKRLGGSGGSGRGGAIAAQQMHHVVMSGAGADVGALVLEDFLEVVDYDPVRHVALVVGRRSAPPEAAILWLLCRVFPAARFCCVVPGEHGREPQRLEANPPGSFEEAMAVARALKAEGGPVLSGPALAVLERVGLVLVVPPTDDLDVALATVLQGQD
jgi:hypothetical protein